MPRGGSGRPRTRSATLITDKADSSRANRAHLRRRGIAAVIPERDDQLAHRRRGHMGGRPSTLDVAAYRDRPTT